jgi:hypothetical protein
MNAVLDRRVAWSELPGAFPKPDELSQSGDERPRSAKETRTPERRNDSKRRSQASSVYLQSAEGIVSTVLAGAWLCVSVGFSLLMIAAMLVVFLCGLACYS